MNIKPVQPGVFRGPQPQTIEDWFQLTTIGIKFTLDLETGSHFLNDGSPLKEMLTSLSYNIVTFCHPLGEILPPTQDELTLACGLIATHQPIYVHCKAGVDRTGMVIAKWRTMQNPAGAWPKTTAINEMVKMKKADNLSI